ncbi:MAG: hypothetical protein EA369_03315 [Bradymonadales bacterium]|nr:MAG: hypothetical protein EA369_03315 [Bradymonadales bacterium]
MPSAEFLGLLQFYAPSFLAGTLMAVGLALWGCFIVDQKRVMESFALSQAAGFGSLLGLSSGIPHLLGAGVSAGSTPFLFRVFKAGPQASPTGVHAALYIFFLAASYLLIRLSPHLESHFSLLLYGDVSLIHGFDLWLSSFVGILAISWAVWNRRFLFRESFEFHLFSRPISRWSRFMQIALIVFSMSSFGFLFSIAFLTLPTSLLQSKNSRGIFSHFYECGILAGLSFLLGFFISLCWPSLPSTPCIVLCLLFICLLRRSFRSG